jgi:hypothetical protein
VWLSYRRGMITGMRRPAPLSPPPSPPDYCGGCHRDRPLHLVESAEGDHENLCRDRLRGGLPGQDLPRLDTDMFVAIQQTELLLHARDEASTWAREMWVTSGLPWLPSRPHLESLPDWLVRPKEEV